MEPPTALGCLEDVACLVPLVLCVADCGRWKVRGRRSTTIVEAHCYLPIDLVSLLKNRYDAENNNKGKKTSIAA